jgi:hypothetical protein
MPKTPTYADDYADDLYVGLDDNGNFSYFGDDADAFSGYANFFDFVEAHAVYAEVAENAYQASRLADERELNHALRYDEAKAKRDKYAANLEASRAASRERVRKHRALKRAKATALA